MTQRDLAFGKIIADAIYEELGDVERPKTRADCQNDVRPCPFISCKHHLYLDVAPDTGAICLNFPDVEPDQLEELPATCALDVADRDGETLEVVGEIMNVTRARIGQIEVRALSKMKRAQKRFPALAEQNEFRDESAARALEQKERSLHMSIADQVWAALELGPGTLAEIAIRADVSNARAGSACGNFFVAGKVSKNEDGVCSLIEGAKRLRDLPKRRVGQTVREPMAGVVQSVLPDGSAEILIGPTAPLPPPKRAPSPIRITIDDAVIECASVAEAVAFMRARSTAS